MTRAEAAERCLRGAVLRAELVEVELQAHLKSCPGAGCRDRVHLEHQHTMRWLSGLRHSRGLPGWAPPPPVPP